MFLRRLIMSKVLPVFMYSMVVTYPRNKVDRSCLERLNRYVARTCTKDYVSPYCALLERTGMKPVFQSVLYERIQLAQKYSRGQRYLPPSTVLPNQDRRLRSHGFALHPFARTEPQYRDSALEFVVKAWNRLPDDILQGNAAGVKNRLVRNSYSDALWDGATDLRASLRLL